MISPTPLDGARHIVCDTVSMCEQWKCFTLTWVRSRFMWICEYFIDNNSRKNWWPEKLNSQLSVDEANTGLQTADPPNHNLIPNTGLATAYGSVQPCQLQSVLELARPSHWLVPTTSRRTELFCDIDGFVRHLYHVHTSWRCGNVIIRTTPCYVDISRAQQRHGMSSACTHPLGAFFNSSLAYAALIWSIVCAVLLETAYAIGQLYVRPCSLMRKKQRTFSVLLWTHWPRLTTR